MFTEFVSCIINASNLGWLNLSAKHEKCFVALVAKLGNIVAETFLQCFRGAGL